MRPRLQKRLRSVVWPVQAAQLMRGDYILISRLVYKAMTLTFDEAEVFT